MKLIDILKKMGIDVEKELEYTNEQTLNSDNKSNNKVVEDKKEKDEVTPKNTKETKEESKETVEDTKNTEEIKMEIKFDEKTGLFD